MKNKIINLTIGFFFIIYFAFNLYLLPHYGLSWDEPFHYIRGNIYLQYFLTGNGDNFGNNPGKSIYESTNFYYEGEKINSDYLFKKDDGHPPLNGILSALFNKIFYQKTGILGDIESYHLFVLLTSFFLIAGIFYFVKREYGIFPAIISFLSITLYPLFFSESHFNIKDPVQTAFYTGTIIFLYLGITKNEKKSLLLSSVFAGFALSTKFNIVFVPFIVLPWLIIYKWNYLKSFKWPFSSSISILIPLYIFIPFGILVATWPFLWSNPLGNFMKIVGYYKEVGYGVNYQPSNYMTFGGLNTFALQWIAYSTPVIILFLTIIGIIYSIIKGRKEKNKLALLVLFWFLVPILRVTYPKMGILGGVREIMEYIPAMAILSGIGAKYLAERVSGIMYKVLRVKLVYKKYLILNTLYLILILSFLPITLKLISIHPNENVYLNPLIGGVQGAKDRNIIYWGNTFGNVYRQGVEWINRNAEKNSFVVRGISDEETIPFTWFRGDIKYAGIYKSGFEKKGEYIIELTHDMPVWSYFYYLNYAKNVLNPVYQVKVDNVPILTIWKNDLKNTKDEFKKADKEEKIKNYSNSKTFALINLEKEVLLTRIDVFFGREDCNFTDDGYFVTSDSEHNWTNHSGNLGEMEFYKNFNPRSNKNRLSYLFPAIKAETIKIIHSEENNCFDDVKELKVRGFSL